jgi:maltooligosyltrehalose trehalohydrolase
VPANRLVAFAQNHDQVGNRAGAERLVTLVGERKARLAMAAVLLSPHIPLLFMGEEYAETSPFPYFVDHSDPDLLESVRRGRAAEFGRDADEFDPGAEETMASARLDRSRRDAADGRAMLDLVRTLLALRRSVPLICDPLAEHSASHLDGGAVVLHRGLGAGEVASIFNFSEVEREVVLNGTRMWRRLLDSAAPPGAGEQTAYGPLVEGRVRLEPWGFAVCEAGAVGMGSP